MAFKTLLVDIDKITSKVPRSNFAEEDLEKLAQFILELNGIVQPLVVQETSLEEYEIIEGDFQFYGALKAWEIDDDFETISAFIVNEKENDLVTKQLDLLRQLNNHNQDTETSTSTTPTEVIKLDHDQQKRIDNLEKRLNRYIENNESNLNKKVKQLEVEIEKIREKLPTKLDLLTAFNTLEIEKLISPLQIAGINNKELDKVVKFIREERKKKPFASLADIMERSKRKQGKKNVRLITENKLIQIIDRWSKIAFDL